MFDFHKWSKEQTDKIFLWFDLDEDPIYTPRFKKFIKFVGYKLNPFILSVASFIILYWILNRVATNYGIEKMLALVSVIVIFTLRGMADGIKKLTE